MPINEHERKRDQRVFTMNYSNHIHPLNLCSMGDLDSIGLKFMIQIQNTLKRGIFCEGFGVNDVTSGGYNLLKDMYSRIPPDPGRERVRSGEQA